VSSIPAAPAPYDHASPRKAIDELYRGMVMDLKSLGQRPDRDRPTSFQSLDLEQDEILLGLHACGPGRDFSAPKEPPNLVPQVGERRIVDWASIASRFLLRSLDGSCHQGQYIMT
jgi:hypothetical protein